MTDSRQQYVRPLEVVGEMSNRPDRNCLMCGSRDWCEHNPDPGPREIVEQMNPNAQARLDGIVARRQGLPKSANPHGHSKRAAWAQGWREADRKTVY